MKSANSIFKTLFTVTLASAPMGRPGASVIAQASEPLSFEFLGIEGGPPGVIVLARKRGKADVNSTASSFAWLPVSVFTLIGLSEIEGNLTRREAMNAITRLCVRVTGKE